MPLPAYQRYALLKRASVRRKREEREEMLARKAARQLERQLDRCECDFDCVGDPPRYVRSNHKTLCPVHDTCCCCDERLAVIIDDGDKLCAECATEEITRCPNCDWETSFSEHSATSREPHGETHDDVWLTCNHCHKRTDDQEVKDYNAARLADIHRRLEELQGVGK
jgi:hypothetical protein